MSFNELAEAKQPCDYCQDLDNLEFEVIDEPHHGEDAECGECNATYYQTWGGTIYSSNEKAKLNHPELKTI